MNKANSLKQHLLAEVPELQGNPDKLLVFIDQGRARSTVAAGLSFEYGYTLNAILTDFAGHPDAVIIPVIAWMKVNQPDLMENLAQAKDAIQFEADILANDLVDMSITLPLTERVIVKQQPDGTLDITRLRQARYLKLQSDAGTIAIGFLGRAARLARVHQYGLRDRPGRNAPDVQYNRRQLLGFTDADLDLIRDRLLDHLAR